MYMKILADLHCHTIASGHAYSSLEENIAKAKERGLKVLGISEHAPEMPGSAQLIYFYNLAVLPREIDGLILLKGVEANIMDFEGNMDMPTEALERLDYAIAGLHPPCIEPGTMEENTRAILRAMENPLVNIIAHPDDSRYPLDYEALVKASKEYNVALEINNSSLHPNAYRQDARENVTTILKLCKQYETRVIFNSDAHFSHDVGNLYYCIQLAKDLDFPDELVINYSKTSINNLLNKEIF